MNEPNAVPFGLLVRDPMPLRERGYTAAPIDAAYDPQSQIVPSFIIRDPERDGAGEIYATGVFGDSSPTTSSSIYSTGIFDNDTDEGADDTGTD